MTAPLSTNPAVDYPKVRRMPFFVDIYFFLPHKNPFIVDNQQDRHFHPSLTFLFLCLGFAFCMIIIIISLISAFASYPSAS